MVAVAVPALALPAEPVVAVVAVAIADPTEKVTCWPASGAEVAVASSEAETLAEVP
jgi:hypothetical protein